MGRGAAERRDAVEARALQSAVVLRGAGAAHSRGECGQGSTLSLSLDKKLPNVRSCRIRQTCEFGKIFAEFGKPGVD